MRDVSLRFCKFGLALLPVCLLTIQLLDVTKLAKCKCKHALGPSRSIPKKHPLFVNSAHRMKEHF